MLDKNRQNYAFKIAEHLAHIRDSQPIVHNITNYVAMTLNANLLLAVGASPIMAHAIEEVAAIVHLSKALVINIGTLDTSWLMAMSAAMQAAAKKSIPIIIDPVGVGATLFRTQAVLKLLEQAPVQVIRGNAAEILALAGDTVLESKGVDSLYPSEKAVIAGKKLAKQYQCVVVISGEKDFIISNTEMYSVANGVALMSKVTAMGCSATALIGAFCAGQKNYLQASTYAMATMGIVGEIAAAASNGPGSFQMQFLDALYNLLPGDINSRLKIHKEIL